MDRARMDNKKDKKDKVMIVIFPSGMIITGNMPEIFRDINNNERVKFKTAKIESNELNHTEVVKDAIVNLNNAALWYIKGEMK